MAKLVDPGTEMDLGEFGYSEKMIVYWTQEPCAKYYEDIEATKALADFVLENGLHKIVFTSDEKGTGFYSEQYLAPEDARHFEIGDEVMFHHKRNKLPGFGELAYIERDPQVPAISL